MDSAARLKIGISACFMHADPARPVFSSKTLQFVEQSIAHWVMSTGALAVMVPSPSGPTQRGDVTLAHYAHWPDGLVLHGGADVSPLSYGEQPLQERWSGDRTRDEYEIELAAAFERHGKPVFGVCRGLQLMNVAFGGTPGGGDSSHRQRQTVSGGRAMASGISPAWHRQLRRRGAACGLPGGGAGHPQGAWGMSRSAVPEAHSTAARRAEVTQ